MNDIETVSLRGKLSTARTLVIIKIPNFKWKENPMRTKLKGFKASIKNTGVTHNTTMGARIGKLFNTITGMIQHTSRGRRCHLEMSSRLGVIQLRIIMRLRIGSKTIEEVINTTTTTSHSIVATSD